MILASLPRALAQLAEDALRRQGVELVLNEHVQSFANGVVWKNFLNIINTICLFNVHVDAGNLIRNFNTNL